MGDTKSGLHLCPLVTDQGLSSFECGIPWFFHDKNIYDQDQILSLNIVNDYVTVM